MTKGRRRVVLKDESTKEVYGIVSVKKSVYDKDILDVIEGVKEKNKKTLDIDEIVLALEESLDAKYIKIQSELLIWYILWYIKDVKRYQKIKV